MITFGGDNSGGITITGQNKGINSSMYDIVSAYNVVFYHRSGVTSDHSDSRHNGFSVRLATDCK